MRKIIFVSRFCFFFLGVNFGTKNQCKISQGDTLRAGHFEKSQKKRHLAIFNFQGGASGVQKKIKSLSILAEQCLDEKKRFLN